MRRRSTGQVATGHGHVGSAFDYAGGIGEQGDLARLPALVQEGLDRVIGRADRVVVGDVDDADR